MTSDDRQKDWLEEHLGYEYQMLHFSLRRMIEIAPRLSEPANVDDRLEFNAHYVSFAVHARNLYSFLTNGEGHNNFNAHEFVKRGFASKKSTIAKKVHPKFLTQVFHTGMERPYSPAGKIHLRDCAELANWINTELNRFIDAVPADYRSEITWARNVCIDVKKVPPSATNRFTTTSVHTHSYTPTSNAEIAIKIKK